MNMIQGTQFLALCATLKFAILNMDMFFFSSWNGLKGRSQPQINPS